MPLERLRVRAAALAKLAALHELPAFASSVPPGGAFLADVLAPLPSLATVAAHGDLGVRPNAGLVELLRATGARSSCYPAWPRRSSCNALRSMRWRPGFGVHVAVDACGGVYAHRGRGVAAHRPGGRRDDIVDDVRRRTDRGFYDGTGPQVARHRSDRDARALTVASFSPAQAIIAAMITPALLILASASLIATALVRLGASSTAFENWPSRAKRRRPRARPKWTGTNAGRAWHCSRWRSSSPPSPWWWPPAFRLRLMVRTAGISPGFR